MKILLATALYGPLVSGSAQGIVEHLLASGYHVEVVTLNFPLLEDSKEFDNSHSTASIAFGLNLTPRHFALTTTDKDVQDRRNGLQLFSI